MQERKLKASVQKNREENQWGDTTNDSYVLIERSAPSTIYDLYIYGLIEDNPDLFTILNKIRNAEEEDVVNVYINSPGGYVSTAINICNVLKMSSANVIAHLEGDACSAAAVILLSCNNIIIYEDTIVMLHNYSGDFSGKGHEIRDHFHSVDKRDTEWLAKAARRILTEEEVDAMIEGKDFWIKGEEVAERIALRNSEAEELEKASTEKKSTSRKSKK